MNASVTYKPYMICTAKFREISTNQKTLLDYNCKRQINNKFDNLVGLIFD